MENQMSYFMLLIICGYVFAVLFFVMSRLISQMKRRHIAKSSTHSLKMIQSIFKTLFDNGKIEKDDYNNFINLNINQQFEVFTNLINTLSDSMREDLLQQINIQHDEMNRLMMDTQRLMNTGIEFGGYHPSLELNPSTMNNLMIQQQMMHMHDFHHNGIF